MQFFKRKIWRVSVALLMMSACLPMALTAYGKQKQEFIVVVDAGHGGDDNGSAENQAVEKDINLKVARKLGELLGKMKDTRVVFTREGDSFVSLSRRAEIANEADAHLLISIHTNSAPGNPNSANKLGVSTFSYYPDKNLQNRMVTDRENSVIELDETDRQTFATFSPAPRQDIYKHSKVFAEDVMEQMMAIGRKNDGKKSGGNITGYVLLGAAEMPGVLIELDYICNPEQAAYLNSYKGQEELAEAIFEAVKEYEKYFRKTVEPQLAKAARKEGNDAGKGKAAKDYPQISKEQVAKEVAEAEKKATDTGIPDTREYQPQAPQSTEGLEAPENQEPASGRRSTRAGRRHRQTTTSTPSAEETSVTSTEEAGTVLAVAQTEDEEIASTSTPIPVSNDNQTKEKGARKSLKSKDKKDKSEEKEQEKESKGKKNSKDKKKDKEEQKRTPEPKQKGGKGSKEAPDATAQTSQQSDSGESVEQPVEPRQHHRTKPRRSRVRTEYRILVLTSDRELKPDDSSFKGIAVESFRENNQYKYTHGRGSKREDLTELLEIVREKFPDATIIERTTSE